MGRFALVMGITFALFALAAIVRRVQQAAARDERERIEAENAARLERQNKVAAHRMTKDEIQKSLRDGTF